MRAGALRLRRFRALVVKETLQALRDPSTLAIAVVLPLILLFLFGYGISLDARNVRLGVVVEDDSALARELAAGFAASRYFEATFVRDRREVTDDLVAGRLRGVVVVPQDFSERWQRDRSGRIQVLTDGSVPNTASFVENYTLGVWRTWLVLQGAEAGVEAVGPVVEPRIWFNPELESRFFLVPGSIAIVMTLIGTLLTALVVAREWERGSMEAMMATPVGSVELLAGKLVPYLVLGMGSMAVCTTVAVGLFGVPLRGSVPALVLISAAFLAPALGQGLLISAVTKNQFVASQLALLTGFLPAFMLSGFIFEISSMPAPIRAATVLVPARYLVTSMQTVFLSGDIWPLFARDIAAMTALGAVFFALAARSTRKRLV
jgi:ABC-2 type transport system permease protein